MIRTWLRDRQEGWELTSGAWSPFYFMFREVPSFPDIFRYSVDVLTKLAIDLHSATRFDTLVGVASTGIPLAAGVALRLGFPLAFTRKIAGLRTVGDLQTASAAWGEHALVEGRFKEVTRYVLVDDVVTSGASKMLARDLVALEARKRSVSAEYCGTIVIVDRGYPGDNAKALGICSRHVLYDEIEEIIDFGGTQEEIRVVRSYLENPGSFQDTTNRRALLRSLQLPR